MLVAGARLNPEEAIRLVWGEAPVPPFIRDSFSISHSSWTNSSTDSSAIAGDSDAEGPLLFFLRTVQLPVMLSRGMLLAAVGLLAVIVRDPELERIDDEVVLLDVKEEDEDEATVFLFADRRDVAPIGVGVGALVVCLAFGRVSVTASAGRISTSSMSVGSGKSSSESVSDTSSAILPRS